MHLEELMWELSAAMAIKSLNRIWFMVRAQYTIETIYDSRGALKQVSRFSLSSSLYLRDSKGAYITRDGA